MTKPPLLRRPEVLRILAVALLVEIGYGVLNISTMPVYLRNDRQFGEAWIALILTAFLLSEALFKGPMGHLADRFGHRRFIILAPVISATTAALSLAIPRSPDTFEVAAFVLLRVGDGLAAAMIWPALFALSGNAVADQERQPVLSLINMCYLLGIALAFPLGGLAEDASRTTSAGLFVAVVVFILAGLAACMLAPATGGKPEGEPSESVDVGALVQTFRAIPGYLLLAFITFMGVGFPMAVIKLFAQDQFGLSGAAFGALVFPGAVAMAALAIPVTHLGERVGRVASVRLGLALCAGGMSTIALGAFLPGMRSLWVVALAGVPVGLGFLLTVPAWMAAVSDLDPNRRAANLGAVMTAQGLGAIVGMPLGGLAFEHFHALGGNAGHYAPFLGCAISLSVGWLLSFRVLKASVGSVS